MKQRTAQLIATLAQKGELMQALRNLLEKEKDCMLALDLTGLEETQQEIGRLMGQMGELSETCKAMVAQLGSEMGLAGSPALTPIIDRLAQPEKGALREAQKQVQSHSRELSGALELNRSLLSDSLQVVERSINFFNRLFNPVDTYGLAGSLVSRRGGGRLVCKEI
ncbi:hypothetical protein GMLC_44440 [Geomonas limicola]|uniref:Flagellar protein FlgN n=1 Tax=Geomonas limicola TaxID=2740186 RepID=A0A6V8NE01_9BACT|nr:flagellar protein FlgN [Geomonas limicola]GFO70865.1 hypothetical protein GMLC_44440 [Geomonas limicola]